MKFVVRGVPFCTVSDGEDTISSQPVANRYEPWRCQTSCYRLGMASFHHGPYQYGRVSCPAFDPSRETVADSCWVFAVVPCPGTPVQADGCLTGLVVVVAIGLPSSGARFLHEQQRRALSQCRTCEKPLAFTQPRARLLLTERNERCVVAR